MTYNDRTMKHQRKNLHVPLPAEVHERLVAAASEKHQPATVLVREVLRDWLDTHQHSSLYDAIKGYALAEAGTARDLDRALESAGIAELTSTEPKSPIPARGARRRGRVG